jgi:hypothetical protein
MAQLSIAPRTDGELRLTVFEGDTPIDTAAVSASVYAPTGAKQADNVDLSAVGGSTGAYRLAWQSAWSTDGEGRAITGEFVVEATAIYGGLQRVRRFRIAVQFDDTE